MVLQFNAFLEGPYILLPAQKARLDIIIPKPYISCPTDLTMNYKNLYIVLE